MDFMLKGAIHNFKRKWSILEFKFKNTPRQALICKELWYILYNIVEVPYYCFYVVGILIPCVYDFATNGFDSTGSLGKLIMKNASWFNFPSLVAYLLAFAYFASSSKFVFKRLRDEGELILMKEKIMLEMEIYKYYGWLLFGGVVFVGAAAGMFPSCFTFVTFVPMVCTSNMVHHAEDGEIRYLNCYAYVKRCRG